MAKNQSPPAPSTPEDCEEFLKVIGSSDAPLEATKIVKLASTSRKPKADEAAEILEQLVAERRLQSFPPKTARGKPRYWNREPKTVARPGILEIVSQAPEPLTAKQLKRPLKLPFPLTEPEIAEVLENCADENRIFRIPAKTAKSGTRYWHHDAVEFARQSVLAFLENKGPQTETAVKRSIKGLNSEQIRQLLNGLCESKAVYRHPPMGSSRTIKLGNRPPSPEPYLKKIGKELAKVVKDLTSADVSLAELRRAVIQTAENAGLPFDSRSDDNRSHANQRVTNQADVNQVRAPQTSPPLVDLVVLMKQVEPGAERGTLVTTRDLRVAAKMNKADFDSRALELERQGALVLHRHDFASSLTDEERNELVTDGRGNYYVGLALRPR